jgi:PAS domain S-box-containing protein
MVQLSDQSVLNHLLEGCQIIGFDFRYVFVNDAVVTQAKRTRAELVGRRMGEVYPGIEQTAMFALLRKCMEERTAAEMENEFTYPDGSRGWFALRMEPVPQGVFILSIDISERKRAESEVQKQLHRLEALRAIDLAIIQHSRVTPALQTVASRAADTLGVDAAAVFLCDPGSEAMVFAAGTGFRTASAESLRIRVGAGAAGLAALERRTIIVSAIRPGDESGDRAKLLDDENFHAHVAVPLLARGRLLGVLEVFNRSPLESPPDWLEFLHSLAGQASIAIESARLVEDLEQANGSLISAYDSTIEGWSRALDLRDHETEGHTARVTAITLELARMAGFPEEEIVHIRRGALLHDIGKMGVPDRILLKESDLTEEEWAIMRQHPAYAYAMLYPIEYLRPALAIPLAHHERWDGTGYPRGLSGDAIPLAARLFAVADVWDAIQSDRPYRKAWKTADAIAYMREGAGRHFDPAAVDLLMRYLASHARWNEPRQPARASTHERTA